MDGTTMEQLEDDMFDLDLRAEWLNDVVWSSQFLSPDDQARMDFERMLGAKNSQPRFHEDHVNPSPVWRLGAAASRYITEDGQDSNGNFNYDFTTNLSATTPVLFVAGCDEVLRCCSELTTGRPLTVVGGAWQDVACEDCGSAHHVKDSMPSGRRPLTRISASPWGSCWRTVAANAAAQ
jgi:hypothetical protein